MSDKKEIKLENYTFDDVVLSMYQLSRDLQLLTKAVTELVQKTSNPMFTIVQPTLPNNIPQYSPFYTTTNFPTANSYGGNLQQNDDGTARQVKDF